MSDSNTANDIGAVEEGRCIKGVSLYLAKGENDSITFSFVVVRTDTFP